MSLSPLSFYRKLVLTLLVTFISFQVQSQTIQVGYIENPNAGDPMLLSDTGQKGLSDFAAMVNSLTDVNGNSYAISAIQESVLLTNVAGTLAPYDIILTGSAIGNYAGTPAQELEAWVKAGGTLILYSDLQLCCGADNSVGQDSRNSMGIATWAGVEQCLDQKGPVQTRIVPADNFLAFNMTTREIQGEGISPFIIDPDTTNHPSQGYPTIIIEKSTQSLAKSGGTTFNGTIFELGYSRPGLGLVFFVMDRQGFLNGPGTGTDITLVDNRQFAKNLLFAGAGAITVTGPGGPAPVCKDITVGLDGNGLATISAADIDDGSLVVFGTPSLSINQSSFSCTDLGPNPVILTVSDANGGSNTCTSTVTIIDTISPSAICQNVTIQLDAFGNATLTPQEINNGSVDNCGIAGFSIDKTTFGCNNLGPNVVVLTVTDDSGNTNSCTATVTVEDLIAPIASCLNFSIQLDSLTGTATLSATDLNNNSTDNCGIATMSVSPNSFSSANIGNNTVTLTVTDASGNSSNCTSNVIVSDVPVPVASCNNATVFLDQVGTATITSADVDNGSSVFQSPATFTISQNVFDCTDVGPQPVVLTITDGNGASSNCTSTVTVVDSLSPVAVCQNIQVILDASGSASITTADIDNGSTDNCGISSMTLSQSVFGCADVGQNAITLTVLDAAGNSSNCLATVTVTDNSKPIVACQDFTLQLDSSGATVISPADIDDGSFDLCGIASLTLSQTTFTNAHLGTNSVTLIATDNNGNIDSCTATVTVLEFQPCTTNAVTHLYVVQANTTQDLFELTDGGYISKTLGNINIRAEVEECGTIVESVKFELSGASSLDKTENFAPYVMTGDNNGVFKTWSAPTGSYSITVTPYSQNASKGTAGTAISLNFQIVNTIPSPTLTLSTTSVSCFGAQDGSATVVVSGGVAPYSILWSDGSTGTSVSGLSAGQDSVVVTDNQGTTVAEYFTISEPAALAVTALATDATDISTADGTILLTISGGTQPYNILWDNGGSDNPHENLLFGTYTAFISDANLCKDTIASTVGFQVPPVVATITVESTTCFGGLDGTASVEIQGGSTPYQIIWGNGQVGLDSISGLSAGLDSVTIMDGNGTTVVEYFTVPQPTEVITTATPSQSSGLSITDGSISLAISGGTSPYTVSWNNGATGNPLTGLLSGTYTAFVTDAFGCADTTSAFVDYFIPALLASVTTTDVTCFGGADGSASIQISGGLTPYTIVWQNGQSGTSATNLFAGMDSVTVTDSAGQVIGVSFNISQPAEVITTATPSQSSGLSIADGSISLAISGGTSPYTVSWNNGGTGNPLTGLLSGTYTAFVTDSLGCTDTTSAFVDYFIPALMVSVTTTDVTCFAGADGSASVQVSGGLTPYTTAWQNGQSGTSATGLMAGADSVTVTGSAGQVIGISFTVGQPQPITISSQIVNASDISTADGSITLTIGGGTAPYSTTWSNGSMGSSLSALLPGLYTATVTDINGCSETISATVDVDLCTTHRITRFIVVSVDSNTDLFELNDGDVISSSLGNINIRADVEECGTIVESVRFQLTGATSKTQMENYAPWVLTGDNSGIYRNWDYNLGSHTIVATPFTSNSGFGTPGTPLTVNFQIVGPQSRVIETTLTEPIYSLSVYPNPASKLANFKWESPVEGEVKILLVDQMGRTVRELNRSKTAPSLEAYFPLFDLPSGMYSISVIQGEVVISERFLKR